MKFTQSNLINSNDENNDLYTRKFLISKSDKKYYQEQPKYHSKHNKYVSLSTKNGGISDSCNICYYATVLKITRMINDQGELIINIVTDMDYMFKSMCNLTGNSKIDHVYNTSYMRIGDVYKVILQENNTYDKLYWVWVPHFTNEKEERLNIDASKEHTCPVCGEDLTPLDGKKYCVNNQCPSQLRMSIRRYLQKATQCVWTVEEIITFDKLVTIGRVKYISDIYTLTAKEINSLEPYFSWSEINVGEEIVSKINSTRGTITLFNFLNSLCVPKPEGYILKKDAIDKLENISVFLNILSEFDTHEYSKYMSSVTAHILRNYFNRDSTIYYINKLIDEQVFDS